jgi:hypothetical protein
MKYQSFTVSGFSSYLIAGVFGLALASQALAQGGPPPGQGPPANNAPFSADRQRRDGEQGLRTVELGAASDVESRKTVALAVANVKTDFTRIQVLRNDIARDLVARKPIDYKLVSEQTAEINKRAKELKIYMMARVVEDKKESEKVVLKSEDLVGPLVNLCKLIDSFTENPALKNTIKLEDVDKAKADRIKADKDLLAIIQLSESIRNKTESLKVP